LKQTTANRIRAIGPGTKALLIGVVAFGAYGYFTKPSAAQSTYYEADASGRLVQVQPPQRSPAATPKLWKPEPSHLLKESRALKLSADQTRKISQLAAKWNTTRTRLEKLMESSIPGSLKSEDRANFAALNEGMVGYAELSRSYNRERERCWLAALSVLSARQRAEMEGGNR